MESAAEYFYSLFDSEEDLAAFKLAHKIDLYGSDGDGMSGCCYTYTYTSAPSDSPDDEDPDYRTVLHSYPIVPGSSTIMPARVSHYYGSVRDLTEEQAPFDLPNQYLTIMYAHEGCILNDIILYNLGNGLFNRITAIDNLFGALIIEIMPPQKSPTVLKLG